MRSWLMLLVVACGGKDEGKDGQDTAVDTGTSPTTPEGDLVATGAFDACREAVLHVSWTAPEGAVRSYVEYGAAGALDRVTPESTDGAVDVALRGLNNGASVTWRAVSEMADGSRLVSADTTSTVPLAPRDLLPLNIEVSEAGSEVAAGWVMLSTLGAAESYAAILDPTTGQYVWWITVDDPTTEAIARAKPTADGQGVWWNDYHRERDEDIAHVYRSDFDTCDQTATRTFWGHHDMVELPDGKVGWMGFAFDEAYPVPDYGDIPVATDNIYEAPEGGDESSTVEIWNAFEDWDCPVTYVGPTMDLDVFVPGYHEWTHGNSLIYLPEQDAYFIFLRYLNALVKVDRATGTTSWTLGGPCADVPLEGGGEPWAWPHLSHIWEEDDGLHILAFDNGDLYNPPKSRVVEVVVDEDGRTARTVWTHDHPDGAFIRILGDARRLPGGNTLVIWSQLGVLEEVTPAGEVVWRATSPLGQTVGRANFLSSLYPAVDGSP